MRSIALLAALTLMPATAVAGSITTTSGMVDPDGSILVIGCPSCVEKAEAPKEPPLAPGHEIVRIEKSGSKTKVYRTGNWLGGSPVTYVRSASDADLDTLKRQGIDIASTGAQALAPDAIGRTPAVDVAARDGIDRKAKTGSVADASSAVKQPFDPDGFSLRLAPIGSGR